MAPDFTSSFKRQTGPMHERHEDDDFVLRELVPLSYLTEKNSKWMLQVDLPGVERKNIVLTVTHGRIVVKAKLEEEYQISDHGQVFRFESMKKMVELPAHVDVRRITAKFQNGILTITIPKMETGKRVPVK